MRFSERQLSKLKPGSPHTHHHAPRLSLVLDVLSPSLGGGERGNPPEPTDGKGSSGARPFGIHAGRGSAETVDQIPSTVSRQETQSDCVHSRPTGCYPATERIQHRGYFRRTTCIRD